MIHYKSKKKKKPVKDALKNETQTVTWREELETQDFTPPPQIRPHTLESQICKDINIQSNPNRSIVPKLTNISLIF